MKNNQKLKHRDVIRSFLLSFIFLTLSGCVGDDFSDLEQQIAEIKARPKGKIEPLPPVDMPEPFAFESEGFRDPFVPVEKKSSAADSDDTGSLIKPDPNRVKEDLESYALDTLRMVGTLKDAKDSTVWALVQSAATGGTNGTVHKVKVGNYMGLNDGKIIEISNDEIKITEIVLDPGKEPKRWREQPAALKLVAATTK